MAYCYTHYTCHLKMKPWMFLSVNCSFRFTIGLCSQLFSSTRQRLPYTRVIYVFISFLIQFSDVCRKCLFKYDGFLSS